MTNDDRTRLTIAISRPLKDRLLDKCGVRNVGRFVRNLIAASLAEELPDMRPGRPRVEKDMSDE